MAKATLTKLTAEQEAQIPVIRDEFLRYGLSTEPADFDSAEQAIKDAYVVAGLPAPKIFIRLASPHEGAIGAAILKNTRLGESVGDQVRDQVRAQVGAQVGAQVWAQVWVCAYHAVKEFFNLDYDHPAFELIRLGIMVVKVLGKFKVFGKSGKFLGEFE